MIGLIVGWNLRSRGVVVAVAAALLVLGATQLRDLPVDVLPEFSPPTVEIQTEALGLSVAEVEQLITVPLEQDLLMQAAFGSWRLAGAAFLTLPAALVGGGLLSLGSLVGLVLVLAVAARNAILLISRCQQLARGQDAPTGAGLVMGAAAERLSPILLTAVAIALAVAPLVVRGDIPGYEILQPMAVVILGGLVTATLLSLFVIPTLYLRFGSTSERRLDAAQ